MTIEMTQLNWEVETSIQQQFKRFLHSSSNHCIREVRRYISEGKKECYEPSVVSIGPMHYANNALKPFHEVKLRYLHYFVQHGNPKYDLGQYIAIVRECEGKVRSCYALDEPSLSSNEFIEMVLMDAAFIILYFMQCTIPPITDLRFQDLGMENWCELRCKVHQDLFLVENQIPFFVLNTLFDKAFGATYPNNFKDITRSFINLMVFPFVRKDSPKTEESNVNHLVDFLRICCFPAKPQDQQRMEPQYQLPMEPRYQLPVNIVDSLRICCFPTKRRYQQRMVPQYQLPVNIKHIDPFPKTVKELKAAGVKLLASKGENNLLDISFSKGVLEIPTLEIQDNTEAILRSIVFYEQCYHFNGSFIIDYVAFMDRLINTSEDVEILVENGIIKHWLGSNEEVATLFNQIGKDVVINAGNFYYGGVCEDLNEYANKRWNQWKAILRRDYFTHPWSIISLVIALIIFILTVLQVVSGFKD